MVALREVFFSAIRARRPRIGLILGWEGVLVDSKDLARESWVELACREGWRAPVGRLLSAWPYPDDRSLLRALSGCHPPEEEARLLATREVLYRDRARARHLEPHPGAVRLLEEAKAARVPVAVAAGSSFLSVHSFLCHWGLLRRIRGLEAVRDYARAVDPAEFYCSAARHLKLAPEHCILVEGAPHALRAARNLGCRTVAVGVSVLDTPGLAVANMAELSLGDIL